MPELLRRELLAYCNGQSQTLDLLLKRGHVDRTDTLVVGRNICQSKEYPAGDTRKDVLRFKRDWNYEMWNNQRDDMEGVMDGILAQIPARNKHHLTKENANMVAKLVTDFAAHATHIFGGLLALDAAMRFVHVLDLEMVPEVALGSGMLVIGRLDNIRRYTYHDLQKDGDVIWDVSTVLVSHPQDFLVVVL